MSEAPEYMGEIDDLLAANYGPEEPGATVILTRDGHPLFRKAYGLANIELCVNNEPGTVFKIGSLTKQFTAVAILMLVEQGRLHLDDPLTHFLPDYPTHGHTITVEHLLTHTSGIKSYTGMADFRQVMALEKTLPELIDYFKYQPMDFAPGTRWAYNNSGYVLLGAIIEKVSGLSYADFMQRRIFRPLGLRQTYTDPGLRLVARRAVGYDTAPAGMEDTQTGPARYNNTPHLSMSLPHAAGAMSSTVDDLARWDAALSAGRLISPELLQRAFTPYRLLDGSSTHYGYGWGVHEYEGNAWIEHSGGINGFVSHAARIPSEGLFAAVLSNNTGAPRFPEELCFRILTHALGRPYRDPEPADLPIETSAAGEYRLQTGQRRALALEDGRLVLVDPEDNRRVSLQPISPGEFVPERMALHRLSLRYAAEGQVTGFEWRNAFGEVEDVAVRMELSA